MNMKNLLFFLSAVGTCALTSPYTTVYSIEPTLKLTSQEKRLYHHLTMHYYSHTLTADTIVPNYTFTQALETLAKRKNLLKEEIVQEMLYRTKTDTLTQLWDHTKVLAIGAIMTKTGNSLLNVITNTTVPRVKNDTHPYIIYLETPTKLITSSGIILTFCGIFHSLYKIYQRTTFISTREREIATIEEMMSYIKTIQRQFI